MSAKSHEEAPLPRPRLDSYPFARPRLLAIWRGGFASAPLPDSEQLLVGRGLAAGLRINSASVSREHALVVAGEPPCIFDNDSANGVHVDGVRAKPGVATPLARDSVVELGDAFLLIDDSLAPPGAVFDGTTARTLPPPGAQESRTTRVDVLENAVERVRRLEPASARLQRLADLIATTSLAVMVLGEPGSGRATLAKRLHRRSPRSPLPFLSIDCAAFTSGSAAGLGLLRDASGGTVLLENVSDLPLTTQAELMAILGQPSSMPGGDLGRALDVRLVSTSRADLRELVAAGAFRMDLYLRLRGVQLRISSLRERRTEVLPLAHQFLVEAAARARLPVPEIEPEARTWLEQRAWPGNLPELRAVMERALVAAQEGTVTPAHLERIRELVPEGDERGAELAVTLQESLPEPERPTNPYASSKPFP
jgi:two-component system, NtrC family, response regulator AtoC